MNIFPSDPSLTLEFACFRLVVGNQERELNSISQFRSRATLESTRHQARVWTRVNLEFLGSQPFGISLKLESLGSKLDYGRNIFAFSARRHRSGYMVKIVFERCQGISKYGVNFDICQCKRSCSDFVCLPTV